MDFAEAMEAVERLAGIETEATIWGLGDDAAFVATLRGKLRSQHDASSAMGSDSASSDPDVLAASEVAVVFEIGDWGNSLDFWPSRYVSAERTGDGEVTVTTLDGVVQVRHNRPWID